jgi:type VI secretion system (T6SS) effector Hcp
MRVRDEQTRSEPAARRSKLGPGDPVLALQRSAGNRAVGALLARQPAETATDADTQTRVVLPGIGTVPLLSFSWNVGYNGRSTELQLQSVQGDHSAKLARASIDGTAMDVEVIAPRGGVTMHIFLKGALVSSYSLSSGDRPTESWTLNYVSIEQKYDPPKR